MQTKLTNTDPSTELKKDKYLDAMLETVKLPAGIADLNTSLTNVNRNALSHFRRLISQSREKTQRKYRTD